MKTFGSTTGLSDRKSKAGSPEHIARILNIQTPPQSKVDVPKIMDNIKLTLRTFSCKPKVFRTRKTNVNGVK